MQRINHHHLYIFWVFARTGSFTKTARELSIAQSAVTSQIRLLEQNLDLQLIDRSNPRYPTITAEGRRVIDYADSIFESTRELVNWVSKGALNKTRIIKVGALSALSRNLQFEFVQPILKLRDVKLEMVTGDQESLLEQLNSHELDIVLSSHNVRDKNLFSHVLTKSNLVFVKKSSKDRKEQDFDYFLKNYKVYLPGSNFEAKPELDAYFKNNRLQFEVGGEIDDIALLRIFALRSEGIVIVPEIGVQNEIADGSLKVLRKIREIDQKFYAITKSKLILDKYIESLINRTF